MTPQERRDRKTRAQQAEAALAAEANALDWGRDYYKRFPNLMLIEVAREGYERFDTSEFDTSEQSIAFVRGYSQARINHDEYQREQS